MVTNSLFLIDRMMSDVIESDIHWIRDSLVVHFRNFSKILPLFFDWAVKPTILRNCTNCLFVARSDKAVSKGFNFSSFDFSGVLSIGWWHRSSDTVLPLLTCSSIFAELLFLKSSITLYGFLFTISLAFCCWDWAEFSEPSKVLRRLDVNDFAVAYKSWPVPSTWFLALYFKASETPPLYHLGE